MVSIHIILSFKFVYLLASNLVNYKFGSNFGQIFYDYSGSGNHGQNGQSLVADICDTVPIDRGAYFSTQNSLIVLPPNNLKSDSFKLGPNFSIIMWIYPQEINSYSYLTLRFRSDWADYLIFQHYLNKIYTTILYSSQYTNVHSNDINLIYSGKH